MPKYKVKTRGKRPDGTNPKLPPPGSEHLRATTSSGGPLPRRAGVIPGRPPASEES